MDKLKIYRQSLPILFLLSIVISFLSLNIPPVEASTSSTVGTTTTTNAVYYPNQVKAFYANTRFWVFYSNGTDMVFRTSTDGSTWTSTTTVRASTIGQYFSVFFDGTYVHYACARGISWEALFYRMGTPNANGTITWATAEQNACPASTHDYNIPFVSVDSLGYPYIAYDMFNSTDLEFYPHVTKSSLNNGTWQTDSGFPYKLKSLAGPWLLTVLPLNNEKMYAVYTIGTDTYGRLWNSSAWETEESITATDFQDSSFFSAVGEGDNVHFVFLKDNSYDIQYMERTYGVGWSSEVTIQSATIYSGPTLTIDDSSGVLYVFWANTTSNLIYYKRRIDNIWSYNPIEWLDESTDDLSISSRLTSFYQAHENKVGLIYTSKLGSPYNVKFAYLEYLFIFYGPSDENTGLHITGGANVTAYYTDGTSPETFLVDGTYYYIASSKPEYFRFDLTNDREYWLGPNENSADIYILEGATTVYTIAFLDLAGVLDDYQFVEAKRHVNGTLRTIEKRIVDEEKKVVMSLINGNKYNLVIQNGSTYTFGDLTMTSETTIQLTLTGIDFPKETLLTYKYVRIYGLRTFGTPATIPDFIFDDDFETGDFSKWTSTYGTNLTVQDVVKRNGDYSARFGGGAETEKHYARYDYDPSQTLLYTAFWFRLGNDPFGAINNRDQSFLEITGTGGENILHVGARQNGTGIYKWSFCGIYVNASHKVFLSNQFNLQFGEWYFAETQLKIDNTDGEATLWINGVQQIYVQGDTNDRGNIDRFQIGIPFYSHGNLYSFYNYVDDVQVAESYIEMPQETVGNITITYEDTLEQTNTVEIFVDYRNGTNAYNATETADSFVHTWTSAVNSTDYRVEVIYNHERYGEVTWRQYFPRSYSSASFDLSFLGSLPFATTVLLPSFLIVCAMGCFSVLNAEVGAFVGVVIAIILTYMRWIDISAGYLITAFALAILMGLIYSKRRVTTI